MKKLLIIIAIIGLFIGGGLIGRTVADTDIPKIPTREQVMCPCGGCSLTAVKCGCHEAVEALKKFDKTFRGA
ncbi:MAG: hypothetical protein V3W20_07125 [Candidatus Neomarinimicrobiota bacterium]